MDQEQPDWTTIRSLTFEHEAAVLGGVLEAHGIPFRVLDAGLVGVAPHLSNAIGGVRLQVPEEERNRAASILDGAVAAEPLTAADLGFGEDEEADEAPAPARILQPIDALAWRSFSASLLGVTLLPVVGTLFSVGPLVDFARSRERASTKGRIWAAIATILNLAVAAGLGLLMRRIVDRE